jgi:hypothetical protein
MLPRLIACRMRQRLLMIEHRAEIAHVEPTAARLTLPKMFGGGSPVTLPMIFPRGTGGVMLAILVKPFWLRPRPHDRFQGHSTVDQCC